MFSAREERIGNVDIKTNSVHFYVQRNSPLKVSDVVIPWNVVKLNVGDAMKPSGVFIAPVAGIYHFEFSGLTGNTVADGKLDVDLQKGGINIGRAYTKNRADLSSGLSLTASLDLKANDEVQLYKLGEGELFDDPAVQFSHFTGWLVEQHF